MENDKIAVNVKDLYQMLISEMRYGLARNNHLEPWNALRHARYYVNQMLRLDREWGLATLRQLCEECIEALLSHKLDSSNEELVYHFTMDAMKRLDKERAQQPYNHTLFWIDYMHNRKEGTSNDDE